MSEGRTEQRKSPRIVRLVPLSISDGDRTVEAESAVISAHGALVLSPRPFIPGTEITLMNRRSGACIDGTIVWTGEEEPGSPFKLGVEFVRPSAEFWGEDYRP